MSHAINVNFFLSAHPPETFFVWKTAQILIIPMLVTPVLGPDSLPSAAARPPGLVPCGNPPLPITANRLTQNLPHHHHTTLVQLSLLRVHGSAFSPFLYPFHSLSHFF